MKKKVAQINSVCGYSSTGRTTYDLAVCFKDAGFDSRVYYGLRSTDYLKAYKFTNTLEVKVHILKTRLLGKHAFYSRRATKRLVEMLKEFQPDVIRLGQVHGHYLNIPVLFKYFSESNVPVVWTLHDCWAMTGHCAHFTRVQCEKWKTGCYQCPQKHSYPNSWIFDRSKAGWRDKKKYFNLPKNITLVAPSHFIADLAKLSFLKNHDIKTIYNGVDTNIFKPDPDQSMRGELGISKDAFLVLGMAGKWFDARNREKSIDMIQKAEDIIFVLIGKPPHNMTLPEHVISIDYISDLDRLAKTYACADVFLNLSDEDSFSKVTAEAMACGTPVVGLNSTAIPEVIGDAGVVLPPESGSDAFLEAFNQLKAKDLDELSKEARKRAVTLFNQNKNYQAYLALIEEKAAR
ncbi:MAG: glycosyltransferase [Eubacteriales bacterium]